MGNLDFISDKGSVLLYFIYGLSFFSMGLLALHYKERRVRNFSLIKYIKYLGYFGIVHGVSEWVSMALASQIYYQYTTELYIFKIFLKASSLSFLMGFGINLLEYEGKMEKIVKKIPVLLFILWTTGFFFLALRFKENYNSWLPIYNIMSRYFIGLPAGILVSLALYKSGKSINDLYFKGVSIKCWGLALSFLTYSFVSGAIVNKADFFPANILNKELFFKIFGFPVEVGRTVLAILITLLFTKIIEIFSWEMEEQILRLSKQQVREQERAEMGRELHDCIIQDLFSTGMQVENLMDGERDQNKLNNLSNIKTNINGIIGQVRDFIGNVSTKEIEIKQLRGCLLELIDNFKMNCCLNIDFSYNVSTAGLGYLSSEKLTQIYYIVQEALSNLVKHASATKVNVEIKSNINSVMIIVIDNGKGFNTKEIHKSKGYGLRSIKERAAVAEGILNIESSSKGTKISISIPWEEYEYEY
jgi:signal transduction histidine kinase